MRFFFDNCISPRLTAAMKQLCLGRHEIEHLTDRFPDDTDDIEWIPVLAADSGIILISADPNIANGKKEREV